MEKGWCGRKVCGFGSELRWEAVLVVVAKCRIIRK